MLRPLVLIAIIVALAVGVAAQPANTQEESDIPADWVFFLTPANSALGPVCVAWIQQEGSALSGALGCSVSSAGRISGTVSDTGEAIFSARSGPSVYAFQTSGPLDRAFVGTWERDDLSGTFAADWTTPRWADMNCDGSVSSLDAHFILTGHIGTICRAMSGHLYFDVPNPFRSGADVNLDGRRDSRDALLILQLDAGLLERLPVL